MIFPITSDFAIDGTDKAQAVKVLEEAAELLEAVNHGTRKQAQEEAMDVLQALANLCLKLGWLPSELEVSYEGVRRKNLDRGHYVLGEKCR